MLCAATAVIASPLHKRQEDAETNLQIDLSVLNYALTLEHLEATFYNEGLENFTRNDFKNGGYPDYVYTLFETIREHENTHVSTLQTVIESLNGTAVPPCEYNFNVPDLKTFIETSRALENTGVSAYAGSAKDITNPDLLTAAATILSVEARHAAFLQYITNRSPFPNAFDVPLSKGQIVGIASQFIVSCPYELPASFPALTLIPSEGNSGDEIITNYAGTYEDVNCLFLGSGTQHFTPVFQGGCVVPRNVTGLSYVVITSASDIAGFNDTNTIAGPSSFEIKETF